MDVTQLKKVKELAVNPLTAGRVAKDSEWLGLLVFLMDDKDEASVTQTLEILILLAKVKQYAPLLRNAFGMMLQLENMLNNDKTPSAIYDMADELYTLLLGVTNNSNHGNNHSNQSHEPLQDIKDTSTNQPQPKMDLKPSQKKPQRRNSMLVRGGLGKSGKTIVLQIRGMVNRDDMELCRTLLVKVKGVISITFDFKKKRSMLRCRNDLKPEVLVQAITKSITMTADQVVKNEQGEEVLVSFGSKVSQASGGNKENEDMPDYPPDDDSPVRGDKNMARMGEAADSPAGWGFIKSVGSYLATSFYW